ncbi:HEAT repeat domain-containing protein [Verrucomicrobia bacterium S94]|nr:HEAT repeat domain-containing protein [Verrucomicrobia bacterium S94]
MNGRIRFFQALAATAILLAGCQPNPDDIETWKAENNTGRLIKALNDERQFMRLQAIEALKELNAENAVNPLGALLKDTDAVVVHSAIEALAAINTPSIEPYMLQAVTFDTEPARRTAARALGNLKSTEAVEALIAALDDTYENVGVEAAVALGKIGDAKALSALGEAAEKGSVRYRAACVASIRQIGGSGATDLLFAALNDPSTRVHNEAVAGLIEQGDKVEAKALLMLRSPNDHARQGALTILDKTGKVPTVGNDRVWYCLADLAVGVNPEIRRSAALEIATIEGAAEPLLEALAHPNEVIREHAFIAIEFIGKSAAAPALAAAAAANPEASKWLNGRNTWPGAPAWQLDLWGAATALNPFFLLNARQVILLNDTGKPTIDLLRSDDFRPRREIIPLLIRQMAAPVQRIRQK